MFLKCTCFGWNQRSADSMLGDNDRGFLSCDHDMHLEQLRNCVDSLTDARALLHTWLLRDPERGWRNLTGLAETLSLDGLRDICAPLGRLLPRCPDPDMALNNLERYLANPGGREQLATLLEGRARPPAAALSRSGHGAQ